MLVIMLESLIFPKTMENLSLSAKLVTDDTIVLDGDWLNPYSNRFDDVPVFSPSVDACCLCALKRRGEQLRSGNYLVFI